MTNGFSTASIHAGYDPDSLFGSINTPIYASTTFAQNGLNELRGGFEYTRCGNPTIDALEKAGLRGGVKVMVGGAPVTEEFARAIGADGFAPDAGGAARHARALLGLA